MVQGGGQAGWLGGPRLRAPAQIKAHPCIRAAVTTINRLQPATPNPQSTGHKDTSMHLKDSRIQQYASQPGGPRGPADIFVYVS